jgi:hypothetical protein
MCQIAAQSPEGDRCSLTHQQDLPKATGFFEGDRFFRAWAELVVFAALGETCCDQTARQGAPAV